VTELPPTPFQDNFRRADKHEAAGAADAPALLVV
jgi:hypothetical protein